MDSTPRSGTPSTTPAAPAPAGAKPVKKPAVATRSAAVAGSAAGAGAAPGGPGRPASVAAPATAAPATAKTVGHATPPGTPAPPVAAGGGWRNRRNVLIGAGAALVAVALGFVVWSTRTPEPPRLNAPPLDIAKFAATPAFEKLPFDQQLAFMELLDDDEVKDAVEQAYAEGKLTDDEFRKALQVAYFGEKHGRIKKYFDEKKPGAEQRAYLDKLLDKKAAKKAAKKEKDEKAAPTVAVKTTATAAGGGRKADAEEDDEGNLTGDKIRRDDSRQEQQIAAWPADVQARWVDFHRAYDARKELRKKQKQERKKQEEEQEGATAGAQVETEQ